MSNKKTHGGRREGSGRKRVDFSLIIKVGQAYMRLEQLEYEAQKRAMAVTLLLLENLVTSNWSWISDLHQELTVESNTSWIQIY